MTDTKEELLTLLLRAHDRHCRRFEQVFDQPREADETLVFEPTMRNDRSEILRDGVLNLPARCDFGLVRGDVVREKNLTVRHPDTLVQGYFEISEGKEIWVSPFAWNALDIQFQMESEWPNFKPLRHWYLEFSVPPKIPPKKHVRGVVHRLSGPTPSSKTWTISLDLGTAPPDAVVDLLNALMSIGAKNVSLGACVTADIS